MNYSSRFWLFAPLVLFLTLAGWAMGYWWVAAGTVEKTLNGLNGHQAAPGITISYTGKTISGFPFNIDVVFTGLAVQGQGAHGPFRWTSEQFALHRLTYGPSQDIFEAAGNQTLSWRDGGGKSHNLKFLPGSLRASAYNDRRGLARFDLDMVAAGGSDGDGTPFTAARTQFHLRRDPKIDALDLQISGNDIKTKGNIAGLFGDQVKSLTVYATVTNAASFAPLLAGKKSWAEAAADWRAKGGQTMIGPVAISSARLSLTANVGGGLGEIFNPLY